MLSALVERYPENVRVIYRHFPLDSIHPNAREAAKASEAAGQQGEFWAYHDALYANQAQWADLSAEALQDYLVNIATELGLDAEQFVADQQSQAVLNKLTRDITDANNLKMTGTPTVLIDGFLLTGQQIPFDVAIWSQYVDETVAMNALLDQQYDTPPPMTIDTDAVYEATVKLASGEQFVMELYAQSAPQTVNSFLFLAEEGWFNGVTFHRVIPGFVAQTGDPTGTGRGGPGYALPNEVDPELTHTETGMVAMANSGPDTNGSQWYITLGDAAFLDGSYTIFGRVTEGLEEVVMSISPRDPQDPAAPPGDAIETIEVVKQ